MYNNIILERHYKKGSRGGRFKISERGKKFWKTWDTPVHTMEKQLNPNAKEYRHRNTLVDKINLSHIEAKDYEMKVFDCDRATKKMYEEYYKTHKYE